MQPTILWVENDPDIGRLLVSLLAGGSYQVDWITDGAGAKQRWHQTALMILDLMLPHIDRLDICRHIRAKDPIRPTLC